jgi:diaminohydroxyphosphoribosylaminopyrimidine deaminase/5-amino-6-(5-phosphoribosylamino)uracil reductase
LPDSEFLRRAAERAVDGRLRVEPNPVVGCVLVRGGRIVGEGHHARWGGPHAEVVALEAAGPAARGATAYVTLEPCGHRGKTPPCSEALVRAGVAEVVYAHADPNPETAGRGPEQLRAAGVTVRKGRTPAAVEAQLEPYLAHRDRRRPWIIAKWAMTLDGRTATRSGHARWVTSDEARRWAHREFRGTVDAIVVGAGTATADDPELTNRSGRGGQPLRVVVCGRRPLPRRLRLLRDGRPLLVAAPESFRAPPGADVLTCGRSGRVEIRRLLRGLRERGLERILVEGGGDLLGSLFDARVVDQIVAFVAPRVFGGVRAVSPVAGRGLGLAEDAFRLEHVAKRELGPDSVVEGLIGR